MAQTGTSRYRHGYSLLELLITLVVLGILAGISFTALRWARVNSAAMAHLQTLAQDINTTRSTTIVSGTQHRLVFTDPHSYSVESLAGGAWTAIRAVTNDQVTLSGFTPGDYLLFNTKGFVQSYTSNGITRSSPINTLQAQYGSVQRTIRVTLIGLARVI